MLTNEEFSYLMLILSDACQDRKKIDIILCKEDDEPTITIDFEYDYLTDGVEKIYFDSWYVDSLNDSINFVFDYGVSMSMMGEVKFKIQNVIIRPKHN